MDTAECSGQAPTYRSTMNFRHTYRRSGQWPVTVRVTTGDCTAASQRPTGTGTELAAAATSVQIRPAPDVSNGPERPDMRAGLGPATYPRAGKAFDLTVAGHEPDGILRQVSVRLPDGSVRTVKRGPIDCHDPILTWPEDDWHTTVPVTIASPGTHVLTTTATSTGCDGQSSQTHTTRSTVTVDP